MPLETATYIADLDPSNPVGLDGKRFGDDHFRLIKRVLKATFPNAGKPFNLGTWAAKDSDVRNLSANTVILPAWDGNTVVGVPTSDITFTLPTLASVTAGFRISVAKWGGTAGVIVSAATGEFVNGTLASITMNSSFRYIDFVSLGVGWVATPKGTAAGSDVGTGVTNVPQLVDVGGGRAGLLDDLIWKPGDYKLARPSATPDSGWLWPDGKTLGSDASSAFYKGVVYKALYLHLWEAYIPACVVSDGGRGGTGDADWNVNKTITLPDLRGCALVGLDNLGGVSAGRITDQLANSPGARFGAQTYTLTSNNLPSNLKIPNWIGQQVQTGNSATQYISNTQPTTPPNNAFSILQPSAAISVVIKL